MNRRAVTVADLSRYRCSSLLTSLCPDCPMRQCDVAIRLCACDPGRTQSLTWLRMCRLLVREPKSPSGHQVRINMCDYLHCHCQLRRGLCWFLPDIMPCGAVSVREPSSCLVGCGGAVQSDQGRCGRGLLTVRFISSCCVPLIAMYAVEQCADEAGFQAAMAPHVHAQVRRTSRWTAKAGRSGCVSHLTQDASRTSRKRLGHLLTASLTCRSLA